MGTIAVTGAAGSIGRLVVDQLALEAGVDRVVAIDRAPQARTGGRVQAHVADLAVDDLKPLLEGVDTIVHLAWEDPETVAAGTDRGASVRATRALLDAAGATGVAHLVFVSSATVYGAWPDNPVPLSEERSLRPNPELAWAVEKAEAERLVVEWREDHPGTTAAVLRPAITIGDGDASPFAAALAGIGLRSAEEARPVQVVHRDDVVAAVLLAVRSPSNGAWNVAPDGWIPDDTLRALAGGPSRVALPERLARPLSAVARALGGRRPWPGTEAYSRHPWVMANDRLRAAGWVPSHTNEEAFVASGAGSRWQGLNPKRRQEAALVASVAVIAAGAAGAVALVRRSRRRHH